MESLKYQRKFEELQRSLNRIQRLYDGQVINESGEDSFQSPKDVVLSFFRVSYELKEVLKNEPNIPAHLKGYNGDIETFCNQNQWVAMALDIANQAKYGKLKNVRSGKKIGQINTHVHLLSPAGKDQTELTIEVDGSKKDCLQIARNCFDSWKKFLQNHHLL